ncbi:MAG TPA: pyridoxine 5'-phosphate synthase [Flavobacteriales bacterium]|nr:pyridoxine 5'-phosphate synthase [Flavobacteriales bacterium]
MPRLSVNINKIATLRNARGGSVPSVTEAAIKAQQFGAHGITVHPRPDERHIRYSDVRDIKKIITTELNIEGNPREPRFMDLVLAVKPHQVTLVPDQLGQITSDHGWNTVEHKEYLVGVLKVFKENGIRTSIFVDPDADMVIGAKMVGTDRIELYTETYAREYKQNRERAVSQFAHVAEVGHKLGLGINAGHDLNLENLKFFKDNVPGLLEVSIGHALISDCIYYGMENTIQMYLRQLK